MSRPGSAESSGSARSVGESQESSTAGAAAADYSDDNLEHSAADGRRSRSSSARGSQASTHQPVESAAKAKRHSAGQTREAKKSKKASKETATSEAPKVNDSATSPRGKTTSSMGSSEKPGKAKRSSSISSFKGSMRHLLGKRDKDKEPKATVQANVALPDSSSSDEPLPVPPPDYSDSGADEPSAQYATAADPASTTRTNQSVDEREFSAVSSHAPTASATKNASMARSSARGSWEDVSGAVEMETRLDLEARTLTVGMQRGRDLAPKDSDGLSDPYAIVKVSGHSRRKTSVVKDSLNPTWNETFVIELSERDVRSVVEGDQAAAPVLKVTIEDRDTFKHDFMGWFSIPLVEFADHESTKRWYTLHKKSDKAGGSAERGEPSQSSTSSTATAETSKTVTPGVSSTGASERASPVTPSEQSTSSSAPSTFSASAEHHSFSAAAKTVAQTQARLKSTVNTPSSTKQPDETSALAGTASKKRFSSAARTVAIAQRMSSLATDRTAEDKSTPAVHGSETLHFADVVARSIEHMPARAQGEIKVKLRYRAPPSPGEKASLDITVMGAKDLAAMDKSGTSDPYVVVRVDKHFEKKTRVIAKTLNPDWNERFEFLSADIDPSDPASGGHIVEFEVWDRDRLQADDFMGLASFSVAALSEIPPSKAGPKCMFEGWLPLYGRTSSSRGVQQATSLDSSRATASAAAAGSELADAALRKRQAAFSSRMSSAQELSRDVPKTSTKSTEPASSLLIRRQSFSSISDPRQRAIATLLSESRDGVRYFYRLFGQWRQPAVLAAAAMVNLMHAFVAWYLDTPLLLSLFVFLAGCAVLWWAGQMVRFKPAFWEIILKDAEFSESDRDEEFERASLWLAEVSRVAEPIEQRLVSLSSTRNGLLMVSAGCFAAALVLHEVPDLLTDLAFSFALMLGPGVIEKRLAKTRTQRVAVQKKSE